MIAVVRCDALRLRLAPAGLAAALIALAAGQALAASGDWSATASGDWSDAGNWTGGTVADGAGFTATFASDIAAATTVTLDTARTISAVTFGDANTATAGSWVIGGASNTLTLDGNGGNATLTVNALGTGSTATISRPIATANIVGSLVKNGAGTLILGADNSTGLTSKVTISGGSLQISNQNQLGAVPGAFVSDQLTISGGTLRITTVITTPQNRGITIGSGGATLSTAGGASVFEAPFSGSGNTVTTVGGVNLSNQTATSTDVNWDFTGGGSRAFYNTGLSLGSGSARVRSGVRLVSQNNLSGTVTATNPITLDDGAGITARATAPTVSYTNVIFPASGTIIFNRDDQATTAFSITSGGALTGDLTFNTWQDGAAALGAVTLSGVFSGAGGITKAGSGTDKGKLTLGGANTYAGNTTISAGTLALGAGGSIANSASIDLAASTTLDVSAVTGGFTLGALQSLTGVGSVVGNVTAAGTLSPGLSGGAGTISFGNGLSLGSGATLSYQLNGTDPTVGGAVNDLISLTGDLTLDGTINVTESGSFLSALAGDTWRLVNYTGTLTDNTLSLGTMPALASGLTFSIDTTTPNQVNLVVNAVPEPGTIVTALVGLGLGSVAAARRRIRRGS